MITSYSHLIPNLFFLATSRAPVSTCSEDEEVSKPVQEAGIAAYIKIDPELQWAKNFKQQIQNITGCFGNLWRTEANVI